MSTRATIQLIDDNGTEVSIYKHHDGYIKGGLGELLMNFVAYSGDLTAATFVKKFTEFVNDSKINSVTVEEMETISHLPKEMRDSNGYVLHGDTEFHYTIKNGLLFVKEKEWDDEDMFSDDYHWTEVAKNRPLARAGFFFQDI
jgi:hypothetical protein